MKILLQAPQLIDPASPFHLKEKNVLINNGKIVEIGDKNFSADRVIKAEGMKLSCGWFDLGTTVCDPGNPWHKLPLPADLRVWRCYPIQRPPYRLKTKSRIFNAEMKRD
jgi:formylmethanofuran dehydrogenase subunit A